MKTELTIVNTKNNNYIINNTTSGIFATCAKLGLNHKTINCGPHDLIICNINSINGITVIQNVKDKEESDFLYQKIISKLLKKIEIEKNLIETSKFKKLSCCFKEQILKEKEDLDNNYHEIHISELLKEELL